MSLDLRQLGPYELQERLGHSSVSDVWKAYDVQRHCFVALKVLARQVRDDPDSAMRFRREVDILLSLQHPNLARLYEAGTLPPRSSQTPSVYLVTDYIEGQTLAAYLRSLPRSGALPPWTQVVQLMADMSLALDYAHERGVVHGRLKPANILLYRNRTSLNGQLIPVITDIGLMRLLAAAVGTQGRQSLDALFYTSPEQARGAAATERSDLYTLGVILYELCTGMLPFQGNRPVALLMQHAHALPTAPDLINPALPSALTLVILRSLAKDPAARFASASHMTVALAKALHTPLPEHLSHLASLVESETYGVTTSGPLTPLPDISSTASLNGHAASEPSSAFKTADGALRADQQTTLTTSSFSLSRPTAHVKQQRVFLFFTVLLLLTMIVSGGGTLALLQRRATPAPPEVVGHGFFLNSGQLQENTTPQGINDELQINLSGIPDPGPGYSYYAWLLPDKMQTEAPPIFLGALGVKNGSVHFLYKGGPSHLNLLAVTSRFLITRQASSVTPLIPPLDSSLWRYYAEIPQAASPADKLHFSMLDHFRHLLVESPELTARGLHGGLALWLVQNTQQILTLATSAREAWQTNDMTTAQNHLIRVLDYLDGRTLARTDLPRGLPALLPETRTDQIPLLGLKPQNADPPGYSYSDEQPPGYVYLVSLHLSGALLSQHATQEQRKLATQINATLNTVARELGQVHDDAKQLVSLNATQLAQPSSLAVLNDLVTQSRSGYAGQLDQATGQSQGGVLWIYGNVQRLVDFVVTPYAAT